MALSEEMKAALNAMSERIVAIKDELAKMSEQADIDPNIDRMQVLETCHALRAEMIRLRKRVNELTDIFADDEPIAEQGESEEFNTNPFIDLKSIEDIKS